MSEDLLVFNRKRIKGITERTLKRYKEIFVLYNSGYTYKQITEKFDISISTVSVALFTYRSRFIDEDEMLRFCTDLRCPERVCGILYRLGYETIKEVYDLFENNTAMILDIPNMGDAHITKICNGLIDGGYDVDIDEIFYIKNKFRKHARNRAMSNGYFETLKNFPSVVNKVRTEKDLINSIHINPKCIDYIKPKLITKKVRKEILKIQGVV